MTGTRIPVKTRLHRWHLNRVPFPSVPFATYFSEDPLVNGSVFAAELRQEQLDQIRTEILCSGWPEAVQPWNWVWAHKHLGGSLGMGKTALLGYVTDQINRDFGSSFFHKSAPWLAVYVKVAEKTKTPAQVLASALASMYATEHGVSVERRLLGRLRHKAVALNTPQQYPPGLSAAPETKFADDAWLESQGVQLDGLQKDVVDVLKHGGVRVAVATAFSRCTLKEFLTQYKDDADSAWFTPAHTNSAFVILLNDIAKIAVAAGLTHVTFILDDFYFLVKNTNPAERPSLAAKWRDIAVDGDYKATKGNVFNWVAVMHANTAGGFNHAWESASMHDVAALAQTIGDMVVQPGVHLRALPKDLGHRLLESYLKYSRFGHVPSAMYPFTEEAITYLLEYARQKGHEQVGKCDPRSLLEVAHLVFVRALLDTNDHAEIDLAFAQHILEGIPLPVPTAVQSEAAVEAEDESLVVPSERRMPVSVACGCECHSEDGSAPDDLMALIAGGSDGNTSDSILGYVCLRCNTPVQAAS